MTKADERLLEPVASIIARHVEDAALERAAEVAGSKAGQWAEESNIWRRRGSASNAVRMKNKSEAADELATAIRAMKLGGGVRGEPRPDAVKVKPLEWRDRYEKPLRENDLIADSVCGQYVIRPSASNQGFRLWMPGMDYNRAGVHLTVDSAKAAAQADYEARIRAALTDGGER